MFSTLRDESGRTIWDISPPLSTKTAAWPGDTPYRQEKLWSISKDCPVNVGKITLSPHFGAHADAPLHYASEGEGIGEVSLFAYLGDCQVIHVLNDKEQVTEADIAHIGPGMAPRILLRTYQKSPLEEWDPQFKSIADSAVEYLARRGVKLIGTDTPSLDPQESKEMKSHMKVREHRMAILEGLVLDHVPEGRYELIALPLRFTELDASPVRAILRSLAAN